MLFPTSLLSFLLLAVSAYANSILKVRDTPVSLPIARNLGLSGATIVDIDRARAAHFIDAEAGDGVGPGRQKNRRQLSFEVTNAGSYYTIDVGVGSPPTNYTLVIDTGSSTTWVGANKTYVPTSTSQNTGKNVSELYGTASFEGIEYLDMVTLSPELVVMNQSIGIASTTTGVDQLFDGILGLGPVGLTNGTVEEEGTIPTVMNNLFSQGTIKEEVLSVFFAPTNDVPATNGYLTLGGVDKSKTTSDISYVPVTDTSPSSWYWGVNQTITYGTTGETILPNTAGIADTGSSLILLCTSAFNKYVSLTGAIPDNSNGLLKISNSDYEKLQSLFFHIGDQTYEFTANAQTWPRSLNGVVNGTEGEIYLIVADMKRDRPGFSFINGYVFLERFYSVYDTTNTKMGFATTAHTYDTSN